MDWKHSTETGLILALSNGGAHAGRKLA